MTRRHIAGEVLSIRIASRELGAAPHAPVIKAIFEFTLANGLVIESTEEFGAQGIMNENLEILLRDLRKVAGINER